MGAHAAFAASTAPLTGVRVLKKTSLIILIAAISTFYGFAESVTGIVYSIRFYDKAIYFSDSRIYVRAEIYNNSPETFRFKVSPQRVFNIDFEVRTLANEQLEHSEQFIIDRNSDQPLLYREVSLEPGERYAVVEDLTDYVSITKPGTYTFRSTYHPELDINTTTMALTSNYLALSIHVGTVVDDPETIIDRDTGNVLQQQPLPPDEVIAYMLTARQKSDWNKFFLYIDIEGLYTQDRGNEESYTRRLSDSERREALRKYREALASETTTDDFLLIPTTYQITKTSYTPNEATVLVVEKFAYSDFTEVKQYTYYLRRRDTIWTLYNYEVQNLGTE